jgi:hypothetical protein
MWRLIYGGSINGINNEMSGESINNGNNGENMAYHQ